MVSLRLYRIYGSLKLRLCLEKMHPSNLNSGSVYVIDYGREIIQWNGSNSSLQHRTKCRIICHRINKCDRQSKAEYREIDENDKNDHFWERIQTLGKNQDEKSYSDLAENTNTLYKVSSKIDPDLEKHIVLSGDIKKSVLADNACYILDAGVEFFLWIGKNADTSLKVKANEMISKLMIIMERPEWISFHNCHQFAETEYFKLRFIDWETDSAKTQDWKTVFGKY